MNAQASIKSIGGLAAAVTIALAALIVPVGLTGAYAQEALTATTTIDSVQLNPDRTVTVTYTVYCSEPATIEQTFVGVTQSAGKFGNKAVSGGSFTDLELSCDETGTQITTTVVAETGFFTPGRAVVRVFADVCNEFECFTAHTEQVAKLKP
jgi:hypothetical protein